MIDKLYSLKKYLDKLSFSKEALFLEALIKEANKGGLFIEYDDSNPNMVSAYLIANIDGKEESVAEVYASKLQQRFEGKLLDELKQKGVNSTGWWHIHAPGFTWEGEQYKGLGYGTLLYLVLIKYITETGGVIISAPISGSAVSQNALGVRSALKRISGVSWIDVALTSSSERINIESLESLSEDDKDRLLSDNRGAYSYLADEYDNVDANQYAKNYRTYEEEEDLRSKERAFLDEIRKKYENHYIINRELQNFRRRSPTRHIDLSQGTVYWASDRLPISIPVRRREDSKKDSEKTNFFAAK